MADSPPIPPAIWARLLVFLRTGKTGRITFHIHRGRVIDADISEKVTGEAGEPAVLNSPQ